MTKTPEEIRFEKLRTRYTNYVHKVAFRMLSNADDASDAAQEVWIRVWENPQGYNDVQSSLNWLTRITTNICLNMIRKQKNIPLSLNVIVSNEENGENGLTNPLEDMRPGPEEQFWSALFLDETRTALNTVTELQRQTFLMKALLGLSSVEIARLRQCKEGAVRVQYSDVRKKLRMSLTDPSKASDLSLEDDDIIFKTRASSKLQQVNPTAQNGSIRNGANSAPVP